MPEVLLMAYAVVSHSRALGCWALWMAKKREKERERERAYLFSGLWLPTLALASCARSCTETAVCPRTDPANVVLRCGGCKFLLISRRFVAHCCRDGCPFRGQGMHYRLTTRGGKGWCNVMAALYLGDG